MSEEFARVPRDVTLAGEIVLDPRYTPPWPGAGIKSVRRIYDCCEHCEHGINDAQHLERCPEGCPDEGDQADPGRLLDAVEAAVRARDGAGLAAALAALAAADPAEAARVRGLLATAVIPAAPARKARS